MERRVLAVVACSVALAGCVQSSTTPRPEARPSPTATAGTPVTLAQARAAVGYALPTVTSAPGDPEEIFLTEGDIEVRADRGEAVVFRWGGDLTLTVDPTLNEYDPESYPMSHGVIVVPQVKGDPEEEPRWVLRTIRRNRLAVGVDPTEDHYGMLSWSERDVFLTFQSPELSLDELIQLAESIRYRSS